MCPLFYDPPMPLENPGYAPEYNYLRGKNAKSKEYGINYYESPPKIIEYWRNNQREWVKILERAN